MHILRTRLLLTALVCLGLSVFSQNVFAQPVNVEWTDFAGVAATGNSLTKVSGGEAWNAGASSMDTIPGNGSVDFMANETNTHRMCGLALPNTNASFTVINHAIYLVNNATVQIYESGVNRGTFGTYMAGDRFIIERTGTTVVYKKNGVVFYTSTVSSSGEVIIDTSLYSNGATIADAKISGRGPRPARILSPASTVPLSDTTSFQWGAGLNITQYRLSVATTQAALSATGDIYDQLQGTNTAVTVNNIPSNGAPVYVRLWSLINGTWYWRDYTYATIRILSFGETVNNTLETATAIKYYQFAAQANDTIVVVSGKTSSEPFYKLMIEMYDGNGVKIGSSVNAPLSVKVTATGNYYLWVSDDNYNSPGSFSLTVQRSNNPNGSVLINFGDTVAGDLTANADVAFYSINAQANDTVGIVFGSTTAPFTFTPQVHLYDSNGVQIGFSPGGSLSVQVAAAGNYYIWISDAGYNSTGNFSLTVQRKNNPSGSALINFGDTVVGSLAPHADVSFYNLSAQANDTIVMIPAKTSNEPFYKLMIEMYDGNGVKIGSSVNAPLSVKVTATGNYYLWVSDDNYNSSGSFSLTVQRSNNPGGTALIDFGETATGSITSNADVNFYSLNLQANDTIVALFSGTPRTATFSPQVSLYDSNGAEIAFSSSQNLTFKVLATGTYYLWVSDGGYNGTGTYRLTLTENLLTNVKAASPIAFDPTNGESTAIQFTLDRNSEVTIKIYKAFLDAVGAYQKQYVTTVADNVSMPAGINTFTWDGKDSTGSIMAPSGYVFSVQAVNGARNALYDPAYVSGMVQVQNGTLTPAQFDPYQGEAVTLKYNLIVPSWVILKIGLGREQTARRLLINNQPRDISENTEYWDGRDDNGALLGGNGYFAVAWATIFPDNGIIIKEALGIDSVTAQPYAFFPMYNQATEIAYVLSKPAEVRVLVQTPDGSSTVRTLVNNELKPAGPNSVFWDGKDDFGNTVVTPGNYRILVTAKNLEGTTTVSRKGNISVLLSK